MDASLAAAFLGAIAIERIVGPSLSTPRLFVALASAAALALNLTMRRQKPLAGFVIGTIALLAQPLLGVDSAVSPYANQICLYSLGLYATKTRAWWGPPLVLLSVPLYFAAGDNATFEPAGVLFIWLVTWWVGYGTARRREDQERARQAVRKQVLAEERSRTARELHDVVGHTVNVLVVQAGAARLMLEQDPAKTRELLLGMEATGREALSDLDNVLGTLRQDGRDPLQAGDLDTPERPPGLAQVPDLVRRLAGTGIDVSLRMDAGLRLSRSLDLSAYRIVQEGLTNALKHAAPCSADVIVKRDKGFVVVEITDNGRRMAARSIGGRGLQGIAERVAQHGGALEHGREVTGGFRLRAVLPLS